MTGHGDHGRVFRRRRHRRRDAAREGTVSLNSRSSSAAAYPAMNASSGLAGVAACAGPAARISPQKPKTTTMTDDMTVPLPWSALEPRFLDPTGRFSPFGYLREMLKDVRARISATTRRAFHEGAGERQWRYRGII